jgi:tRNA threonylcarbamoyladenosine biosynthesis protein TsaB
VVSLDLSTWWGGVALVERAADGRGAVVVAEIERLVDGSHAPHVLGWIDSVLAEVGWSRTALDGFVATRGPGSFTGVRIGLGTIRGLALASGRPCAAVPTLEAMVHAHGPAGRDRIGVLTAGRRDVFAARYDALSSPPRPIGSPWFGSVESVVDPDGRRAMLIPARGQEEAVRAIAARTGHDCGAPVRGVAAAAARLALEAGEFGPGADLAPLYLRPPVTAHDIDAH